jgi:hypothetical protein
VRSCGVSCWYGGWKFVVGVSGGAWKLWGLGGGGVKIGALAAGWNVVPGGNVAPGGGMKVWALAAG